jgi:uncharacterized protein YlzI (FlbEa/FlbD family)
MHLNEDHVERVEGGTHTAVYLSNGSYLIVRDEIEDVVDRIRTEKAALLSEALRGVRGAPLVAVPGDVP